MSFSNDEEGDGLAALFGGITPHAGADAEPGRRRSAPEPAAPEPSPVPPAAAESPYPGLAPQQPAPPAATPPAAAYPTPASPAYEMPAPQAYDLPAPADPPAAPYPGLAPASPPPAAPAYPPQSAAPAQPASPATPAPVVPQYPEASSFPAGPTPAYPTPAYPPTAQYPAAPADGVPTYQPPAYEPPSAYEPPPAYQPPSAYEPPRAYEPPPAYEPPAYEPPASADPSFGSPVPPAYVPPAYDPPSFELREPDAVVEPPAPSGFEALGLGSSTSEGFAPGATEAFGGVPAEQPPTSGAPVEAPRAEPPVLRSDAVPPATVFPPGPLLPSTSSVAETPEDLERSTAGEKIGVALAILTGPIGLVIAIVMAARGARRRGWVIGIGRASLVLAVLSTIATGIGGYVAWNVRADQIEHADIAAASAEFCAAGAADPAIVTPPTLGWPAPGATITESLALMQAWTDNWTTLAATSPAPLRTGLEQLAAQGQSIIDGVTASRVVTDASNQQQIASIEAQSGVASWYANYCAEP